MDHFSNPRNVGEIENADGVGTVGNAKCGDIMRIYLKVDENGVIVKLADNEITCKVEGPARLLGLEGSNNRDMSDYTDNRHRVYRGRLLAYIQAGDEEGLVRVAFTSPLLKGTELDIIVK